MTRYLVAIWLALGLLAAIPAGVARADRQGALTGQIQNGTPGGGPVGGLPVSLWIIRDGQQVDAQTTVTADDQGAFRFTELVTDADRAFILQTTYQGVTYSRGPLQFEQGQTDLAVTLPVYETTTDDAQVAVEQAHFFITAQDKSWAVTELYVFNNAGDRTYIGKEELEGQRWTSRFTLPANSHNLALSGGRLGGRFLETDNGFVDREPIWPGQISVLFQYDLDCPDGACSLARELDYPLASLNVLVPEVGIALDSQDVVFQGKLTAQGQSYLNYVASTLAAGQRVRITLRPANPTASDGAHALPWILGGGVAVGLVLGYPFWKQQRFIAYNDRSHSRS